MFDKSISNRCFAAFLSLLLGFPTGSGLFTYFTIDHSDDSPDWVFRLFLHVGMEIVGTLFVISLLGLIWALAMPAWLERLARTACDHFVYALGALLLVILGMLAFAFLNRV